MGGSGGDAPYVPPNATPISGVPIAGQGGTAGGGSNVNPYDYGRYQSFLPDIPAEGAAPSAGGLTSDMFRYEAPSESLAPGSIPAPPPAAPTSTPAGPWGALGPGALPQGPGGAMQGAGGLPQITASPVGSSYPEYVRQRNALAAAMAQQQQAPAPQPAPAPPAAQNQAPPDWMSANLTR